MDLASDHIFWTDANGKFIYANRAACASLEYAADEISSMYVSDISPDFPPNFWPIHWQALKAAGSLFFEARQVTKSGRELLVEVSTNIIACDGIEYSCAIVRDISERKAKEQELREINQQIKTIFDTMQAGIIMVNPEGRITFANQRMAAMFGCTLDELLGSGYPEHVHPDQRNLGDERMRRLIAGEIDHVYNERHYLCADGSDFWGHLSGRRLEDADGNLIALLGVIADITDVKKVQYALQESESRYRNLVNSSFDVIFILDPSGTFRFVSPSWEEHFGYPPSEVVGKPFTPFVHQDDVKPCFDFLQQLLATGKPGTSPPYRVKCADGSWKLFIANGSCFIDAKEEALFHGIARDITEQQHLIDMLKASELKYRNLIDATTDAIFIVDMDGHFIDVNSAAYTRLGYTRDELLAIPLSQLDPPEFAATVPARLQTVREQGVSVFESAHLRQDGSIMPIEVNCRLHEYEGRQVYFSVIRDISERKQTEQLLRASEERFRKIIAQSPISMAVVSMDGTIEYINNCAVDTFGYQPEDIPHMSNWWLLAYPDAAYRDKVIARWMGLMEKAIAENRYIERSEYQVTCKNGALKTMLIFGVLVSDKVFVMFEDITERTLAEEKIQRLNSDLEKMVNERTAELLRSNRDLASFCYAISHELHAPVARLKGLSQALQEVWAENPADAEYCAKRIEVASSELQRVINSVLQLSRLAQSSFVPQSLDLSELVREIADSLVSEAPQRQVEVIIAADITACGDASLVRLCLENLVGNAFKYTSRQPLTRIEFGRDVASGAFFIRDNGIGFDMAHADNLFEPFIRLHREDEFAGSGIGLATVQRIIERHGGKIWADSSSGVGATFYFTLTPFDGERHDP
jgi:PAS domain S-box-containing protein